MNSALTKIATAQAAAGGRYPRFGRYLLEVEVIRVYFRIQNRAESLTTACECVRLMHQAAGQNLYIADHDWAAHQR